MSVSLKVQLLSRLLIIVFLGRRPLGWIENIGTTFFLGFFDAFDIGRDMLLEEGKGRGALGQNLWKLKKRRSSSVILRFWVKDCF